MERERPSSFARLLGVHKSTVTRAIASGRLIIGDDGRLDVAENLKRWESTRSGTRPDVAARHQAHRIAAGIVTPAPAPEIASATQETPAVASIQQTADQAESEETLQDYQTRKITAENNLVKLGMALRAHRCYPLDDIRREALTIGATLRASLERLVDQTAPRLAIMTTPQERLALLQQEVARLRAITNAEFPRALRRLRTRSDKLGGSEARS